MVDEIAAVFSDGKVTKLGTLGGNGSGAVAINNAGQVVGYSNLANGNVHAFLYSQGKMIDLGTPPNTNFSEAFAINSSGQSIGFAFKAGHYDGGLNTVPVLFTPSGALNLNSVLPAHSGWTLQSVTSINDAGQIFGVGVFHNAARAFMMTTR